jgi:hypothetical protein
MPEELSDFVQGLTTAITRRADTYAETLDRSDSGNTLSTDEEELLKKFEQHAAAVLDRYVPPGHRRRDSLVFAHLYYTTTDLTPEDSTLAGSLPDDDDRRRSLLTALLAAEVEARGPLRLTRAQSVRLAETYQCLGSKLLSHKLPLHAALAFERAAGLYLQVENHFARDQCLLAQARARHRSPGPLRIKALETISEVLCGYGYQPYRLLGWVALQLVVFSLALTLISTGSVLDSLYLALTGFISPPGLDDLQALRLSGSARILLVAEGYFGVLSLSVFFALLVRRWFRL